MLFRDFGRWVLLACGLFIVAVLSVLAVHVGILGGGAQAALHHFWEQLDALYRDHKDAIERSAGLIGVGLSVTTAALTIHRSWYYAERNLPRRVREHMEREIGAHLKVRPALLATINDPIAPKNFLTPLFYSGYFDWVMKDAGLGRARAMARLLHDSVADLKGEVVIVDERKRELNTHMVTAYLLRAAKIAGDAAMEEPNSAVRWAHRMIASSDSE